MIEGFACDAPVTAWLRAAKNEGAEVETFDAMRYGGALTKPDLYQREDAPLQTGLPG